MNEPADFSSALQPDQQHPNDLYATGGGTGAATGEGGNRTEGGPTDHISTRLPSALEREEFGLMLQGQWSSERLTGVEALLRWQGLEVGELAPSHFIPIAEQDGFITRIGDWVLEQASSAATNWLEHLVAPIYLCVNVSPQQFVKQSITDQIERLIDAERVATEVSAAPAASSGLAGQPTPVPGAVAPEPELGDDEKRLFSRMAEVFAGFFPVETKDYQEVKDALRPYTASGAHGSLLDASADGTAALTANLDVTALPAITGALDTLAAGIAGSGLSTCSCWK